jgi:type IV pilus assembly protein PilC
VQQWWLFITVALVLVIWGYFQAISRSSNFRSRIDSLALKLPVVGSIVHDAVVARFSRTLSTTFAAGVPLVEALDSTAGAAGNAVYARGIRQIRDDVMSGTSLHLATRGTGLFPAMLLQMTAIGEESGSLDEMLSKVADQYEAQVDNAVDSLSSLMEPIIMSILGVLVGGLMIAMYLPIFMIGTVV